MMSLMPLPETVEAFNAKTWDVVEPYVENLLAYDLAAASATAENARPWLAQWSRLLMLLWDTYTHLQLAYQLDTANAEKRAATEQFLGDVYPNMMVAAEKLQRKLVASGYDAPEHAVMMRVFRNQLDIFREDNVPLIAQVEQLGLQYDSIMGAMTVEFDGEEKTIQQLAPYLLKPDRGIREAAWRTMRERQMADRETLHTLFDEMLKLRHQIAQNAGFANYRDYMFRSMNRFDYGPAECRAFHDAIEQVVVPAVAKRMAQRREQLGLESLRPWDLSADPQGRPALEPFSDIPTFIQKTQNIFSQMHDTLAGYFGALDEHNLLELESRKGKAPGGYNTPIYTADSALIYMNAVGVHSDLMTLLHESGHAFHCFEMNALPLYWDREISMEIAEVASMAMELLSLPYLDEFYSDDALVRARVEALEDGLIFMPYMAVVDAFQHWLYETPEHTHAERDAKWAELIRRFMPYVDYGGLEAELESWWQRQLHIFQVPFYYVEYGIAQVGAWQVWRNSLDDASSALDQYRAALALGYTRPLPELFATAGANFTAFTDAAQLGELVTLLEDHLARLEREA